MSSGLKVGWRVDWSWFDRMNEFTRFWCCSWDESAGFLPDGLRSLSVGAAGTGPAERLDLLLIKVARRRVGDWPTQSAVSNSRASLLGW